MGVDFRVWLPTWCLAGALGFSAAPVAAGDAHAAIERMNRALRDLNYEGEFVFRQGERLEALRITHQVRGGQEVEHLVALNGEKREVIRDRNAVTCLVPGNGKRKLERRISGSGFSPLLPLDTAQLDKHYRFELKGTARTAGRQVQIVEIAPRDALRYGYQLHLDSETYLPLRSRMLDEDGVPLSEVLFTRLHLLPDDAELKLPQQETGTHTALPLAADDPTQHLHPPAWRFGELPSGFMLDVHRRSPRGEIQGLMEHFVFSDGLATVSVYVEQMTRDGFEGASNIGTLNALGRQLNGHQVTVVGEVPLQTLERLAAALEPASRQ